MNKKGIVLFKGRKQKRIVAIVQADIKSGLPKLKTKIGKYKVGNIPGQRRVFRLHEKHSFSLPLPNDYLPIENNRYTFAVEEEDQVQGPEKGWWRSYKQKKESTCCYIVAAMDKKHSLHYWLVIGKNGQLRTTAIALKEVEPETCCY